MLKKIFVAVLAVAFVAGFFANFHSVAEAMMPNMWQCVKCGKKVQRSGSNPGQYACPNGGYHSWSYIGDDY